MKNNKQPRHIVKIDFSITSLKSISNKFGLPKYIETPLNLNNWTEKTAEGLSKFILKTDPDWQHLILVKHKQIIDTGKNIKPKTESESEEKEETKPQTQVVYEKESCLEISRKDSVNQLIIGIKDTSLATTHKFTSSSVSTKVDRDLTKDGIIPQNIRNFINAR